MIAVLLLVFGSGANFWEVHRSDVEMESWLDVSLDYET